MQTLPLPTIIRRSLPHTEIGWAIDCELAQAIEGHPHIDFLHRCDRTRWGREISNPANWPRIAAEMRRFIREIQGMDYDLAIDAQGLFKSAIIPFAARIRRRLGFAHLREFSSVFYTERFVSRGEYFRLDRHHLSHMVRLLRAIGCEEADCDPILPAPPAQSVARIDSLLAEFRRAAPLIAIAPFTQWESKRWPIQRWRDLVRRILDETDANLVLIGTGGDRKASSEMVSALGEPARRRLLDLTGNTSIADLYALLRRISVTIAADTAPLHVAAAAGCPQTIGLFGSTSPHRTGPLGPGGKRIISAEPNLPCQPCLQRTCRYGTTECMRRITPDRVFTALSAFEPGRAKSRAAEH